MGVGSRQPRNWRRGVSKEEGEEDGDVVWDSKCDCGCNGIKSSCIHYTEEASQSSIGSYDEEGSGYSADSWLTDSSDDDEGGNHLSEEEGNKKEIIDLTSPEKDMLSCYNNSSSNKEGDEVDGQVRLGNSATQQQQRPTKEEIAAMVEAEGDLRRNKMVKECLAVLREAKQLTPRQLTRRMEKYLSSHGTIPQEGGSMDKPYSMMVKDMFRKDMFMSGEEPLTAAEMKLKPEEFSKFHKLACKGCREAGTIRPECYFYDMKKCLTHGWKPTMEGKIQPAYSTRGNSPKVRLFVGSIAREVEEMKSHGVVTRADEGVGQPVISPLGVVIKTSDLYRAIETVGVNIVDQFSLDLANELLSAKGLKKVKIRITTDTTQSGVNGAALTPPFRMSAPAEASMLMIRNGYMIKIDISRYYYMFLFAKESRSMFHFRLFLLLWVYICVFFGFSAAPYHISTWSAEFQSWFSALKIPCTHYMDDWFIVDATEGKARQHEERVTTIFEQVGFSIQREKTERGQQIAYLGVLYDTTTMTLRFEPLQCYTMKIELERSLAQIKADQQISVTTVQHTCGKLAWYAECVQRGRLYSRSWWSLLKLRGSAPSITLKNQLINHTEWWITTLGTWSNNDCTGGEFPILSYSEMVLKPELVQLVQSDASGVDGFGYFCSTLAAGSTTFVAKCFPNDFVFKSSHGAELVALASYMEDDASFNCITIWITDCLSAVWSVNKGRCFEENDLLVLDRILTAADSKKNQLIALWVPRELNTLADYLSHLCHYCNRDEVRGDIKDLAATATGTGDASSNSRQTEADHGVSAPVHSLVQPPVTSSLPSVVRINSRLPADKGGAEPGIHKINRQC